MSDDDFDLDQEVREILEDLARKADRLLDLSAHACSAYVRRLLLEALRVAPPPLEIVDSRTVSSDRDPPEHG